MLITTCTHCLARFKVTPQQLNLRQGQVRCGNCQKVFSGFEALERFPDDDTGSRILAARAAAAASGRSPHEHDPLDELQPLQDVSLVGIAQASDIHAPASSAAEPAALETLEAQAADPVEPGAEAAPPPVPATDRHSQLDAIMASLEAPAPTRVSRAWVFGCALLAVAFGLELLYAFRAQIAQAYPVTRPALEAVCFQAGCVVPWVNDHALLKLEDSELLEVPGRPGEIALGARIRNLAASPQEFPHLELTLTDLTGQAAARRILRPADYLGHAPVAGEVMASGAEMALQLRLATPNIKPTGYELLLFYP